MFREGKKGKFKITDSLTKQEIILRIIQSKKHGITSQGIAKTAKINYITAKKWADYLVKRGIVGKIKIGYYKIYYFKKYKGWLRKFLEDHLYDKRKRNTTNKEVSQKNI